MEAFERVKNLIGKEGLEVLQSSSVALFGVGGVGSFVAEALVRSGIGSISIFDGDKVDKSNLNRQLIATSDTIDMDKVDAVRDRLLRINKQLKIDCKKIFYLPDNADEVDLTSFDYIVDAIDTVSAKIEIIVRAKALNKQVISCMGTGGKLQIDKLKVGDIYSTKDCPLARVIRRELKKREVKELKVVYSEEQPIKNFSGDKKADGRSAPPSMIFVPAVAGLYIAREVVFDLLKNKGK